MKTFAGIPESYAKLDNAKIVLIPVPYDGTSTWQKGADKGPEAFLSASENMELYDIETDSEVYKNGIYLTNPVTESSSPEAMVDSVHDVTKKFLEKAEGELFFLAWTTTPWPPCDRASRWATSATPRSA